MIQQIFEYVGFNDCFGCIIDIVSGIWVKVKYSLLLVK